MTRNEAKNEVFVRFEIGFGSKEMYLIDEVIDMIFDEVEPELSLYEQMEDELKTRAVEDTVYETAIWLNTNSKTKAQK